MTTSVAAVPPPATVPPVPAPVPGVSPRGIVDGVTVAVGAALALASAYRILMVLFLKDEPPHVELVYTLLVGLAAVVWPSVTSLKYDKFELNREIEKGKAAVANTAEQKKVEIEQTAQVAQNDLAFSVVPTLQGPAPMADPAATAAAPTESPMAAAERKLPPPNEFVEDDPQHGRFGGLSERDGKALRARVRKIEDEWYEIRLTVESIAPAPPLVGPVKLFVHDSFKPDSYVVEPVNGVARLRLRAWGSFTVGAICSDGTLLELDLADPKRVEQPDDIFPNR